MRAGMLRDMIVWQRYGEAQDALGQQIKEWYPIGTAWGRVEPLAGSEYMVAQQTQAETTHRIIIRKFTKNKILPRDRGLDRDGNIFNVITVLDPLPDGGSIRGDHSIVMVKRDAEDRDDG